MEYVERIARRTTFVDDLIVFAILIAVRVNTTKFNLETAFGLTPGYASVSILRGDG